MVELRDRTLDTWRTEHLERDGLVTPADGAEVIAALLALRAMGGRHDALAAAGRCLRARPIVEGEWLVVTADGVAQRHEHLCLTDGCGFDAARVVRLTAASTSAPSGEGVDVPAGRPASSSPDRGAVGFDPSHTGSPRPDGFTST